MQYSVSTSTTVVKSVFVFNTTLELWSNDEAVVVCRVWCESYKRYANEILSRSHLDAI